ncbi:hypothetical protein D3C76_819680 [compost metagenome]
MPRAQPNPRSQAGNPVVQCRVGGHVTLQPLQCRTPDRRRPTLPAELQLPARPLEVHHQVPGNLLGNIPPQVFFHQGQRQVQPGRYPRSGTQVAVMHLNGVGIHLHPRVTLGQRLRHGPMGGHTPVIQQPGSRQGKRPRAHRAVTPASARALPQPVENAGAQVLLGSLRRAGDQQGVDGFQVFADPAVGDQARTGRAHQRPRFASQQQQAIGVTAGLAVGFGEHIERAAGIQQLYAGHGQDGDRDGGRGHGGSGRCAASP